MTRLKEQYDSQIKAAMMKKFGYKNEMQIPKLVKIVVNMGVGDAKENHKLLDSAIGDMEKITGQKAVVCKAKKSVANFKLREGMPIGCKVTLRDGRGNYALGIKEQLIFPEIEYDQVDKVRGMDVIFVTTAHTDEEARELLTLFGMPYAK